MIIRYLDPQGMMLAAWSLALNSKKTEYYISPMPYAMEQGAKQLDGVVVRPMDKPSHSAHRCAGRSS